MKNFKLLYYVKYILKLNNNLFSNYLIVFIFLLAIAIFQKSKLFV